MMDFPASPTVGQSFAPGTGTQYVWDGVAWTALNNSSPALITDTPPVNPAVGQLWWRSTTGKLYIYVDDGNSKQWVETGTAGAILPTDIKGVTDGSNAPAGYVGEFLTTSGSTAYSWGSWGSVCSLVLTAGDWGVSGTWLWSSSVGSGTVSSIQAGFSTASGSSAGFPTTSHVGNPVGQGTVGMALPTQRLSITAPTTLYIGAIVQGSGYTSISGTGYIWARRVR